MDAWSFWLSVPVGRFDSSFSRTSSRAVPKSATFVAVSRSAPLARRTFWVFMSGRKGESTYKEHMSMVFGQRIFYTSVDHRGAL